MPAGVEMFKKNKGKPGDVTVTEEDDKIISEVLTPYWAGKDFSTNFIKSLPGSAAVRVVRPGPEQPDHADGRRSSRPSMRHSQNWTPTSRRS